MRRGRRPRERRRAGAMGARCSRYCDRENGDPLTKCIIPGDPRLPEGQVSLAKLQELFGEGPEGAGGELRDPTQSEILSLSYNPLPREDVSANMEEMLGTQLPLKPRSWATGMPPPLRPMCNSTSSRSSGAPTCARPGEPVNKVYVQFSNDLEGFLAYTLVISEEQGLEFTSCAPANPDFQLDPLNILKTERVGYELLMNDKFFVSLSRSILSRKDLFPPGGGVTPDLEERVKPPYFSLVQLSVRRTVYEGGQVLVFIAVQSEPLAEELVRSCHQLRKRRAVQNLANRKPAPLRPSSMESDAAAAQGLHTPRSEVPGSGVPSRGCPTPRAVAMASNAANARLHSPLEAEPRGGASAGASPER